MNMICWILTETQTAESVSGYTILHVEGPPQKQPLLQCDMENHEHLKFLRNVIVLQEKSQSGVRKLNCKQEL